MLRDPFEELCNRLGGALALVIASRGGFPRRLGAAMAIWPDGTRIGRLGAGCIDADIAAQLERPALVSRLIYGKGGPIDLPLPCGGSVEVLLLHHPDPDWLHELLRKRGQRQHSCWKINLHSGKAEASSPARTELTGTHFYIDIAPPCRLHIHGEGDEKDALSAMAAPLGLIAADAETGARSDAHTAIVTLFHDHDRELRILKDALLSPAFYVGAMGSRRAQMERLAALRDAGLDDAALSRLRGPIGLVAPAREPRLLAASVLAEILAVYDQLGT